jgi:leucine-zipper of insertion element IS481
VHKWIRRRRTEGRAGLADRSSRPRHSPAHTPAAVEARVLHACTQLWRGAVCLIVMVRPRQCSPPREEVGIVLSILAGEIGLAAGKAGPSTREQQLEAEVT